MPFPAIPTFVTAGLVRLGYKFAEKRKWLPDFVYHNLSMQKFKQGDHDQARYYNAIAMQKNPRSLKAQVMQDILNMHHDTAIANMEAWIQQEQQELISLEKTAANADVLLKKAAQRDRLLKIVLFSGMTAFLLSTLFLGMHKRDMLFYIFLITGGVGIVTLFIYFRILSMGQDIRRTLHHQEQLALSQTVRSEIAARKKRLEKLQDQLEGMIKDHEEIRK